MNWLEISLVVSGEIAEAAAEVLSRFAPGGVVIESTAIEDHKNLEGIPTGPLRVCAYITVDENLENTRHRIEQAFWHLSRIQSIPTPEYKIIEETNWNEMWKSHYKPIPISDNLIILPSWIDIPVGSRIPIRIDPGSAFGTGTHPTTQLCLEVLAKYLPQGEIAFDIGCGSGILSIAAVKLGALRVYGVDTDPEAILAARENAKINEVEDRVILAQGSVNEIIDGIFDTQHAPLIFANILTHVLIRLLNEGLSALVTPTGILILSGILEEQVPDVISITKAKGLRVVDQRQVDDWVCIALQH
jgi:ribosomal protein L11 methyltransferase